MELALDRTTMKLTVRDGTTFKRLEGVTYRITGAHGTVVAQTDSDGLITLADL